MKKLLTSCYGTNLSFYIYKVVISVCLFVFPIITHEPTHRFASNFDLGTRDNPGNVLCSVQAKLGSQTSKSIFPEKVTPNISKMSPVTFLDISNKSGTNNGTTNSNNNLDI